MPRSITALGLLLGTTMLGCCQGRLCSVRLQRPIPEMEAAECASCGAGGLALNPLANLRPSTPEPALQPPHSRFHPLPTRPVFHPEHPLALGSAAVLEPIPDSELSQK